MTTITIGVLAVATATAMPIAAVAATTSGGAKRTVAAADGGNRPLASALLAGLRVEDNLYRKLHSDWGDYAVKGVQRFDDTMDPGTATSVGSKGRIPYLPQNDVFYSAYTWGTDGFHKAEDLLSEKHNVGVSSDFGVGILERDTTDYYRYVYQGRHMFDFGEHHDPFSGRVTTYRDNANPSLSIVQVVSSAQAWQGGAVHWTQEQRHQFYTDPLNYITASSNSVDIISNSFNATHDYQETADKWLPSTGAKADFENGDPNETISNPGYDCAWVARQIAVKAKYHLAVTPEEKAAMQKTLSTCPTMTAPNDTDGEWWFDSRLDAKKTEPETKPQTVATTVDEDWSTGRKDNQVCNRATSPTHTCVVDGVTIDAEYAMAKAGIRSAHLDMDEVSRYTEQKEKEEDQKLAERQEADKAALDKELAKNLAEARPSADGKTTVWYKPSGSWQTARVHWNVYAATGIHLTYGQADMTKTDDGWFKATIDNPHGLRVSLMFARSENSFFWDSGYNGVAQDGNLSVQDHKLVEHAPQQ